MNQPDEREQAILKVALKLSPRERAIYLDSACGADQQLRERIIQAIKNSWNSTAVSIAQTGPGDPGATTILGPPPEGLGERAGDRIGRYQLLEQLGEGGMGTVWVAEQKEPVRRKVALKVIKLGLDTKQVVARFEAERQALALMDHPNIAKVFDAGATENGRPFFVMEFVGGLKITDYCDRHNLTTRDRLDLFIRVCQAIEHAHQKGILHRDIKPANILIDFHDKAPTPKVIDFGIAKAVAGQRLTEKTVYTAFEEFIGTPAYMSPEQAEMNPLGIDARSDIYSLGVLLYELLTGLMPFESGRLKRLAPDEIRRIIREEDPPRPSTRLATLNHAARTTLARRHRCEAPKLLQVVRADLDWIVMKCLEKDRTRRYESAGSLAADVQRYLHNQPILARPPSQFYRLRKLVRRHKPAFAVASLTLLAACLVGGLALGLWPGLLTPSPPDAEHLAARAGDRLKRYDIEGVIPRVIVDLKQALRIEPSNTHAWAKLGWAYWLQYLEDRARGNARRSGSLFFQSLEPERGQSGGSPRPGTRGE